MTDMRMGMDMDITMGADMDVDMVTDTCIDTVLDTGMTLARLIESEEPKMEGLLAPCGSMQIRTVAYRYNTDAHNGDGGEDGYVAVNTAVAADAAAWFELRGRFIIQFKHSSSGYGNGQGSSKEHRRQFDGSALSTLPADQHHRHRNAHSDNGDVVFEINASTFVEEYEVGMGSTRHACTCLRS
jgi:hypothetical protein